MDSLNNIELMECDGQEREHFDRLHPEFEQRVAAIEAQFGKQNSSAWRSISTPQHNTIFDDDVVSVMFVTFPPIYDHLNLFHCGRKFFLNQGWVYDKLYEVAKEGDCGFPIPEGAKALALGYLVQVWGMPSNGDLARYKCVYFQHDDHAVVEAWAGKSLPQGKYSTFYAATFDTENENALMRMKTYVYNDHGFYSDWDTNWVRHTNKANRLAAMLAKGQ
jgi:hypothetical protein